jgi:signal transduction histidine kinase
VNYLDPQRPGRVWVDGENHSGETIYRVSDNGRGIQPCDIEKIFNMFERLGQNDMPGEGMGLSYVRSLVRRHGGTVTCESQPGTGSTFTFSISRRLMAGDD